MSILKEFREFVSRGNVIDLAVGVIIGAAFGGIVNSLVKDVLNPIIGVFLGGVDFSNIFIPLNGKHYDSLEIARNAGAPTVKCGVRWAIQIEALLNGADGAGEIRQQVPCSCLIISAQTGNGEIVDIRDRHAPRAQRCLRNEIDVVPSIGIADSNFGSAFEGVLAFTPTQRVRIRVERTDGATRSVTGQRAIDEVVDEESGHRLIRNAVVYRKQFERFCSGSGWRTRAVLISAHIEWRLAGQGGSPITDPKLVHDARG